MRKEEVKVICKDTGDYFYGVLDSSSGFIDEPIYHTIIQNGEFYKGGEKEDLECMETKNNKRR